MIHLKSISIQKPEQDTQFIIATHSPILMAFPEAVLFNFEGARIQLVAYDDLEHVNLMRPFLDNPQTYLRQL